MKTHRNLPHRWMYWHMHIALNQKTLSKSLSHYTIMNDAINTCKQPHITIQECSMKVLYRTILFLPRLRQITLLVQAKETFSIDLPVVSFKNKNNQWAWMKSKALPLQTIDLLYPVIINLSFPVDFNTIFPHNILDWVLLKIL